MVLGCCAAAQGPCGNRLSLIPCLSPRVQSKGVPGIPRESLLDTTGANAPAGYGSCRALVTGANEQYRRLRKLGRLVCPHEQDGYLLQLR